MSASLPDYEIYAIKYATRDALRRDHFIGGDPHDSPMSMDYYVWCIIGPQGPIVLDLGFTAEMAKERKRTFLRCPIESLKLIGVDAREVRDVIISHMHYDHVGNFHLFDKARFHLQAREMAYATGKYMRYPKPGHSYHVEDVVGMVRLNFKGRVEMHEGMVEVAPGITLHPAPGHADGLQVARVHTKRGWVVLASDATHYYEHFMTNKLFTTAFHLGEMLDSFRLLEKLAPSARHIVPGHDPYVMKEYEPPKPSLAGMVVRLDVAPTGPAPSWTGQAGH
jgi:glyoxylase-like metal-dependent hydrolase (beta-lactamase superfamily II)